jgi:magnesium chelatase subunit I
MTKKNKLKAITTLGELKAQGYTSRSVRDEMRENLVAKLKKGDPVFEGVIGYEDSVIPDLQRAILSRHSINLLGLRGQAKTRIARTMTSLLDPFIPVIEGSELNDDPLNPVSFFGINRVREMGDDTPISWLAAEDRYVEKLATPDVTVADLIGDVDPIRAANLRLDYSDQRAIHFGLVPRSNRCIFVINELPDLQARIQVSLFNILQEGDIQIRGFLLRLKLDVAFVFTANPEDYTNRGAIITPLKDRIQSQILTHYPRSIEQSLEISRQESRILPEQQQAVILSPLLEEMLELIGFEARESEFIDARSGVSARLSITARENLYSTGERRALINKEKAVQLRVSDLFGVVPAIIGKVELVYEGEQEGARNVAMHLINKVTRKKFPQIFPDPEALKRKKIENPYLRIVEWFSRHELELAMDEPEREFRNKLDAVDGLRELVKKYSPNSTAEESYLLMELALHGLSVYSLITRHDMGSALSFTDVLNSIFSDQDEEE